MVLAIIKVATSSVTNPDATEWSFLSSSKDFRTTIVSSLIDRESSTTVEVVTAYTCTFKRYVKCVWY